MNILAPSLRLLFVTAAIGLMGCASDDVDPHREQLNELWRQGYGFNNPNPARWKQGKPSVDFFGD